MILCSVFALMVLGVVYLWLLSQGESSGVRQRTAAPSTASTKSTTSTAATASSAPPAPPAEVKVQQQRFPPAVVIVLIVILAGWLLGQLVFRS